MLNDGPIDAAEAAGRPVVLNWRRQALLWMSQLEPEDARRLWQSIRVEWDLGAEPTRLLARIEDGATVGIMTSLPWPPEEHPARIEGGRAPDDVTVTADSTVPQPYAHADAARRRELLGELRDAFLAAPLQFRATGADWPETGARIRRS